MYTYFCLICKRNILPKIQQQLVATRQTKLLKISLIADRIKKKKIQETRKRNKVCIVKLFCNKIKKFCKIF